MFHRLGCRQDKVDTKFKYVKTVFWGQDNASPRQFTPMLLDSYMFLSHEQLFYDANYDGISLLCTDISDY